ncbi:MAG TPA: hypothetical protein VF593_10275 [Chthoniobacteraceae bacterium]
MRGSPLLRAFIAFLAILVLGYPLSRLTGEHAESATPAVRESSPIREITLQLAFTAIPRTVRVLHSGKEVWSEAEPGSELEKMLLLPFPEQGIDLRIQADLPDASSLTAVRVRLIDPAGGEHEKSVWGTGAIDDVLTFP